MHLTILVFTLFFGSVLSQLGPGSLSNCLELDASGETRLYWRLIGSQLDIVFESPGVNYVALGFHNGTAGALMDDSYFLVGYPVPSEDLYFTGGSSTSGVIVQAQRTGEGSNGAPNQIANLPTLGSLTNFRYANCSTRMEIGALDFGTTNPATNFLSYGNITLLHAYQPCSGAASTPLTAGTDGQPISAPYHPSRGSTQWDPMASSSCRDPVAIPTSCSEARDCFPAQTPTPGPTPTPIPAPTGDATVADLDSNLRVTVDFDSDANNAIYTLDCTECASGYAAIAFRDDLGDSAAAGYRFESPSMFSSEQTISGYACDATTSHTFDIAGSQSVSNLGTDASGERTVTNGDLQCVFNVPKTDTAKTTLPVAFNWAYATSLAFTTSAYHGVTKGGWSFAAGPVVSPTPGPSPTPVPSPAGGATCVNSNAICMEVDPDTLEMTVTYTGGGSGFVALVFREDLVPLSGGTYNANSDEFSMTSDDVLEGFACDASGTHDIEIDGAYSLSSLTTPDSTTTVVDGDITCTFTYTGDATLEDGIPVNIAWHETSTIGTTTGHEGRTGRTLSSAPPSPTPTPTPTPDCDMGECGEVTVKDCTFYWCENLGDQSTIIFHFELKGGGWCGFTLPDKANSMFGPGYSCVGSKGHGILAPDGERTAKLETDYLTTFSPQCEQYEAGAGGFSVDDENCVFIVPRSDNKALKGGKYVDFNLAYLKGASAMTKHSDYGSAELDFTTYEKIEATTPILPMVHGIIMFIGWGFILPFGVLFARIMKPKDPLWFKVHQITQPTGYLIAMIGFIIAFIMTQVHFSPSSNLLHALIGTLVMIAGLVQIPLAFVRPHKDEPKRKAWELQHWITGKCATLFGLINCILGLLLIDAAMWVIVLYIVWLVVYFVIYCGGSIVTKSHIHNWP